MAHDKIMIRTARNCVLLMVVSKQTLEDFNKKTKLSLKLLFNYIASASQVMGYINASLKPMAHRIEIKSALFQHDVFFKKKDSPSVRL